MKVSEFKPNKMKMIVKLMVASSVLLAHAIIEKQ